jgi:hypothetical protein
MGKFSRRSGGSSRRSRAVCLGVAGRSRDQLFGKFAFFARQGLLAFAVMAASFGAKASAQYQCMTCRPGTYSAAGHVGACLRCPAGYYCPGGTVSLSCGEGAASPAGAASRDECLSCPPGQYLSGRNCFACPIGSYCPGGAAKQCPDGMISRPGAGSQSQCCAGSRSEISNSSSPNLQSARGTGDGAGCSPGTVSESGNKCMCRIQVCGQWSGWIVVNAWYPNCINHCAGRIGSCWDKFVFD